jgi:hypothetical protein
VRVLSEFETRTDQWLWRFLLLGTVAFVHPDAVNPLIHLFRPSEQDIQDIGEKDRASYGWVLLNYVG